MRDGRLSDSSDRDNGEGSKKSARARHEVEGGVAVFGEAENGRRNGGRESERQGPCDVEHAEVLCGRTGVRQDIDDQGEVDSHVHAKAHASDAHSEQVTTDPAGSGDDDQCSCVDHRGADDEDLSPMAGEWVASSTCCRVGGSSRAANHQG